MFRSATFKLTLWYLAIVMAISLLFSIVLYHFATDELARGLHRETDRIYNQFPVFQGNPLLAVNHDYTAGAHRILLRLVGLNILVLGAAGLASYFLARRSLQPIEAAHELQKRFTADVSHELRTPLTAIKMESEVALLNSKAPSAELRHTLESNLEEVGKLETLINNLLRLTRLEEEDLKQNFALISVGRLVKASEKQVKAAAEQRKITIITKVTGQTSVFGDETALAQLLVILLDNAIKYSPEGGVVHLESALDNAAITLSVKDSGRGIEKAALDHVLIAFTRLIIHGARPKAPAMGWASISPKQSPTSTTPLSLSPAGQVTVRQPA